MEPMTFDTPGPLQVELRIPAGSIRLRAADVGTTELAITGERTPDDLTIQLTPAADGHTLLVATRQKRGFSLRGTDLRVDLVVPTDTKVGSETGSADLDTTGTLGSLNARSGSGDISFETVDGDAVVKVASGDVRGDSVTGHARIHSASGDVAVQHVGGSLACRTASGDVEVETLDGSAQVTGASGDIRLGSAAAGTLTLRSVSGDISVGVAPGIGVWLDLSSTSGDAISDLAGTDDPPSGASLEIHATAVSGDVRVSSAAR